MDSESNIKDQMDSPVYEGQDLLDIVTQMKNKWAESQIRKDYLGYFLMAVCANENQQNLLQDVQKVVGIPSDYSNLKTSNGLQSIIEMPEVLDKALAHALLSESISATKYVLNLAKDHFVNVSVTFEQIEDLVTDFPNTKDVLRLILKYDISMKWDSENSELNSKLIDEIRKSNLEKEEIKSPTDKPSDRERAFSEELKYGIQENEEVTTLRNSQEDMNDVFGILLPLQTQGSVYLKRECVIEAVFRIRKYSTEMEFEIVRVVYNNLKYLERHERVMLATMLTAYRKLNLIELIFNHLSLETNKRRDDAQSLTQVLDVNSFEEKGDQSFNANVLIKNIAMYSIERDDIFFLGKLMERYEQIITQSSVAITDAIISSLEDQYESGKQPTFILEKFKTVETV